MTVRHDPASSVDYIPDFNFKVTDDLLSRFQVHDGCPNLPGHCAICGSSNGLMFDFGVEVEFFGHVYLCVANCFREAANRVGYFSTDQVIRIQDAHDQLVEHQKELIEENRNLNNALDSLARVRVNNFDSGVDQLLLDTSSTESDSEISGAAQGDSGQTSADESTDNSEFDETVDESVPGEAGPVKQDDGKRFTSLSGDDSMAILEPIPDI